MEARRLHQRYRCSAPLFVEVRGKTYPVIPQDIAIGGCYSSSPPQWELHGLPDRVRIPVSGNRQIETSDVEFKERIQSPPPYKRNNSGFVLKWRLNEADGLALEEHIRAKSAESSISDKTAYVIEEQRMLVGQIDSIEQSKRHRTQLLYTLIIAYLAYLVAPFKVLPNITSQAAAFYALGGVWVALALLVHSDRHLHFLGVAFRQKAYLLCAINANRGYVFASDPHFFNNTIMPIGIGYPRSRAWSYSTDSRLRRVETLTSQIRSSWYPTLHILFLQLVFLAGLFHFAGMLLRTIYVPSGITADVGGHAHPELFSMPHFVWAIVAFQVVAVIWIQFVGNTCVHYHRALWEAKRISVERPNPRATGEAFRNNRIAFALLFSLLTISAVYSSAGVHTLWTVKGTSMSESIAGPLISGMFSVWGALSSIGVFLIGKVIYTVTSIRAESKADRDATPC